MQSLKYLAKVQATLKPFVHSEAESDEQVYSKCENRTLESRGGDDGDGDDGVMVMMMMTTTVMMLMTTTMMMQ